jgi:hypothetical protein
VFLFPIVRIKTIGIALFRARRGKQPHAQRLPSALSPLSQIDYFGLGLTLSEK